MIRASWLVGSLGAELSDNCDGKGFEIRNLYWALALLDISHKSSYLICLALGIHIAFNMCVGVGCGWRSAVMG